MSYLAHAVPDHFDMAMKNIEQGVHGKLDDFDAVLCTGLSGIIPAAIFCYVYGKSLVVLRKEVRDANGNLSTGSHGAWLEGSLYDSDMQVKPYIIIDDFMSSGDTMRRLLSVSRVPPEFVILYNQRSAHLTCIRRKTTVDSIELKRGDDLYRYYVYKEEAHAHVSRGR